MAEAKTYDEKIIKGIEQILTDYQDDFFIQAHLKLGESFHLFSNEDDSSSYCLQRDGIHYLSPSGKYGGVVPIRQAAEDYLHKYVTKYFNPQRKSLSVTGVKLQLLTDLEELAEEFRKSTC